MHARLNANPGFVFVCPGIDYKYRENWNDLLMVEHHTGEGKMSNEEYERSRWSADQLCPEAGGRKFEPRTVGSGYVQQPSA